MALKSLVICALALSIGAGAAFAGPPGCPPGHAKKGECGQQGKNKGAHGWRRGDRIEPSRYVVIDRYGDYGYKAPPPGHRYVQVDGEVLLVAIATGIIADILLNN